MSWCTIESDPGVFTELIQGIGVKGVQVEELYTLDQESFSQLKPVYGLIFLFKWRPGDQEDGQVLKDIPPELFFAKQVINNACATQAILSILLNREDSIDLGEELRTFKSFSMEFPPELKGFAISNSDTIRNVHNGFSREEIFSIEEKETSGDEDVYHFISYIPFQGALYELDGLKDGPIYRGECNDDNWLEVVAPIIQRRIERYSASEIRFNLLAVIQNRQELYEKKLQDIHNLKAKIIYKLVELGEEVPEDQSEVGNGNAGESKEELPTSAPELKERLAALTQEARVHEGLIGGERTKFDRWRIENLRRKHNYVPFLVNFLKLLSEKGQLLPLIEQAKKKSKHG